MSSIIDYLKWRGDIEVRQLPLGNADYAVLGCIAYYPFDNIVPTEFSDGSISLGKALNEVIRLTGPDGDGRKYHLKEDGPLAAELLQSPRFSNLKVTGFVNIIDRKKEEQFSAVSIILPDDKVVIAFRGTDKSLVGWKEDFNLGYLDHLPAQLDSVAYLEKAARFFRDGFYLVGHSKGGNLAMYAGAFSKRIVQERIIRIVSLDGPGFSEKLQKEEGFDYVKDKMIAFIPQGSMVGLMLEHPEVHEIIRSNVNTVMQHSLYTWEITRGDFTRVDALTERSIVLDATVKEWIRQMTIEQRSQLVDGIYAIVRESGIEKVEDFFEGKKVIAIFKAMGRMPNETRTVLEMAYKLFAQSMKRTIPRKQELMKAAADRNAADSPHCEEVTYDLGLNNTDKEITGDSMPVIETNE